MIRVLALAACLLAVPLPATATAAAETPAHARANLATLFSDEDYPIAAVRAHEQGTVQFRISVGADGSPTLCRVIASSGSATLDETTCRLLMERARFEPARDAKGKPVPDTVTARIVWRLPDDIEDEDAATPPVAILLWSACVMGEAAKLVPGDLPADQAADRAFLPCKALEGPAAERIGVTKMAPARAEFAVSISAFVAEWRRQLKEEAASPPAQPGSAES